MPARNLEHEAVVEALKPDGWTITHDPLFLSYDDRRMSVDLGAEKRTLAAEKGDRRIAVEIQSLLGASPVRAIQEAVGQYDVYRAILAHEQPDRTLYMAVSQDAHEDLLSDRFGQFIVAQLRLRLL